MNIANGHAKLFISELTENSVAEVSEGDVYLNVPKNIQELFKIKVTAPSVKIDSKLKHIKSDLAENCSKTPKITEESSSSLYVETIMSDYSKNEEDMPILEVNVRKGTVNISVFQKDKSQETNYECGNLL